MKKKKPTPFSDTSFSTCAFRILFISKVPSEVSKNTCYSSSICFTAIGMHNGKFQTTCFWISNFLISDQYFFFIKRNTSWIVILVIYMFCWLFRFNEAGKTGNVLDIINYQLQQNTKLKVLEKQISYSHCEVSKASMESTVL